MSNVTQLHAAPPEKFVTKISTTWGVAQTKLKELTEALSPYYEGDPVIFALHLERAKDGHDGIQGALNQITWARKELEVFQKLQDEDVRL